MVIRTLISTPVRWVGTIVGLWILLNVISITGYPTGAPIDACGDMMPGHHMPPQDNIDRLGITMTTSVMADDDDDDEDNTVHVTLMGIQPIWGFFKGFMIQARHVGGDTPVGTFNNIPEGQQGLDCNGIENSAVTHTNRNRKFGVSFSWKPSKKDDATNLVFVATIVKTYSLFWTNITSDVLFPAVSTTPSGKNDPEENNTSTDPIPTTNSQISTVVIETTQLSTIDSATLFQNVTTMAPHTDEFNMTTGYSTTYSPSNTTKEYTTEYANSTTDSLTKYLTDSENATTMTYDTTIVSNVTDNVTTTLTSTGATINTTSESVSNTTTKDVVSVTTESTPNTTSYTTSNVTSSSSVLNFTTGEPDSTTTSNPKNVTSSSNISTMNPTIPADNKTTTEEPVVTTDTVITAPTTFQTTQMTTETTNVTDVSTTMNETQTNATFQTTVTPATNETSVGNMTTTPSPLNTTNTSLTPTTATTTVSIVTNDSSVTISEMTTSILNGTSAMTVPSNTVNGTTMVTDSSTTLNRTSSLATTDTTMLITNEPLTTLPTVTNDSFVTTNVTQSITNGSNVTSVVTDSSTTVNGTLRIPTADTTMLVTNVSLTTLPTVTKDSFVTTNGNQSMTTISNVTSIVTDSSTTVNGTLRIPTADTTMLVTNVSLTTLPTVTNDSFVTTNGNQSMTTISNVTLSVTTADTTMSVTNMSLTTLSTTDGNQSLTTISNVTSMVTESFTTLVATSSMITAESNSTRSLTTTQTKLSTGTTDNMTSASTMTPLTSEPTNRTTIVTGENVTTAGIVMTTILSTEPARVTTSGTTSITTQQTTVGTATTSLTTPDATTSAEQSTSKSTKPLTNGQTTVRATEPRIATTTNEQSTVTTESVTTSSVTTVPLTSKRSTTISRTSVTPAVTFENTVQAPIMESNDQVFLRFRITGVEFKNALTQPTSPQYMSLEAEVISLMQQIYSSDSNLRRIYVTRFLEGSVIPEVRLEFTSALDENSKRDVVGVLYNKVDESGGQLGNFTVDSVASLDEDGSFQSVDACFVLPCPSGAYCYVDPNDNQCWLTCDRNSGYCLNGGTCVAPGDGETIATCSCTSNYEDRRCDVEKTSVSPTVNLEARLITILASICGVMAVLFFILAVVLVCWCRRLRYTKRVIEEDAVQVAKWQDRARRSRVRRDAESSGDETAEWQSGVAGTSYIRTEPDAKVPRNLVAIPDELDTSSGSNFYLTDSDSDSDFRPKIIEGGVTFPFFDGNGSIPDLLASAADYEMDVMQNMTGNKPLTNSMRGRSVSFSDIQQVISDDDRIGWENFTFGSEAVNPSANNNFQMRWDFQVGGNRSADNTDDANGKDDDDDERNKGGGGISGETNA